MSNNVERKMFLGMEVRVVNKEYIVLKDMFDALGRVKDDGGWNHEYVKLTIFLEEIGKMDHSQKLRVVVKRGQSEEVHCLKLDTVPIVLTQFKPTKSNRRTAEENEEALNTWRRFMMFVDELLTSLGDCNSK